MARASRGLFLLKKSLASLNVQRKMCSQSEDVLFLRQSRAGVVILNRPKALNAVNYNIVSAMLAQLRSWEANPDVDAITVKGAGEKAFSAGGDVVTLTKAAKTDPELYVKTFSEGYNLDYKTHVMKKPYVTLVDGIAMGQGVGISVHGRFSVATERTLFAMPETALGFFPDDGGSFFLPRLKGKVGIFLGLTGHRLKGRDVHSAGVTTHFVDSAQLPALEEKLASSQPIDFDCVQSILNEFQQKSEQADQRNFSLEDKLEVIDKCFGKATVKEIFEALKTDGSEWSSKQIDILSKMSPTSLRVTFEQLTRGASLPLNECLKMEYRLAMRYVDSHDFHEGVRAILIDKDHAPKWDPPTLSEVSEETVLKLFSTLPPAEELDLPQSEV